MTNATGSPWERLDRLRRERGLLTPNELMDLAEEGTAVLDPFSVLVSCRVELHPGITLYPGAVVDCDGDSRCSIGAGTTLYGGTRIRATGGAVLTIGRDTEIGDGGARITAVGDGGIRIGDGVRISGGAEVIGPGLLGSGSQVLGPVSARSVDLAAGGPYTHPDPDQRGAVLKGFGRAHGIHLGTGEVLNGTGDFADASVQRQRHYHPDAPHLSEL
ncbi:hypothetical protein [Streptomyces melanogenes]|uniref:Uncharacterized protein n=1 Tax=Streptomyces melanogenes TaxID=67326 RepID=A0ABZ1XUV4_9ACTN|nr:hypothetical protein [Streptomyces melanogenes]